MTAAAGPEDHLNIDIEQPAQLLSYLRASGYIAPGEEPRVQVLAGGVSNRTVLVEMPGRAWVLKQALAKLRVQVDWFSSPERIHREAAGIRVLAQLAPPGSITPLVFKDATHHLLAMEAVPTPHRNWKEMLLEGEIESGHVAQFAALLGTVQREAFLQRTAVEPQFTDRSFFESLRLEPYYEYTAAQVPAAAAFLGDLVAATRARRLTLVHGDYSPKNVLVYNGRLVLLDHEVIHWGDPAFDLGFALTHLLSKAHFLPARRAAFAAAAGQFFTDYSAALGEVPWRGDLEAQTVRHTLACLLARVAGRSTLEYLTPAHRQVQKAAVLKLLPQPPATIDELTNRFLKGIEAPH